MVLQLSSAHQRGCSQRVVLACVVAVAAAAAAVVVAVAVVVVVAVAVDTAHIYVDSVAGRMRVGCARAWMERRTRLERGCWV